MTFEKYFIPTEDFIKNLKVGDFAPNAFGKSKEVVEIFGQKQNIYGQWFVCFYTKESETSRMSNSLQAGQLHRHAGLRKTSRELDLIEKEMLMK